MRARIVKINDKTVVLKGSNDKFATVAKSKLQFKYQLGDYIIIEKDGDKLYFLPDSTSEKPTPKGEIDASFLDDMPDVETKKNSDGPESSHALVATIISLSLAFVGWFVAFFFCLIGAIAATIFAFTKLKESGSKHDAVVVLMVINIIVWVVEIAIGISGGVL